MPTINKIFVTGGTGNQGGATVKKLLVKGFNVKALVRDPLNAKLDPHKNLEIIKGDLNEASSYDQHLYDCDGVFCNLVFKYGVEKEIKQGFELVHASGKANIKYFVYSSVIGCDQDTGIPHWESKNKIENHIKASGISYTILRPASLYENLLIPQVKSRILKGKLVLPTKKDTVQQFISSEDIGKIVTIVFSNQDKYQGKTINLAAEQMDGEELAETFSISMGRKIKFQQLPIFITRLVMGRNLTRMFRWINNNDACFVKDLQAFRNEFPGMLSLENWIKINFK